MRFRKLALCAASFLAISGAGGAYAQEQASTAQAEPSEGLAEIVVTARRREENLQDTPVSVTALSGEALDAMNIVDLQRISNFAPGLQMSSLPGSAGISVSIRGISASDPILTNEPSIGIYTDGVYINPLGAGKADLLDIERIEVLRGPQGTLFGRNTTGGAMQIYTRRPSSEAGVEGRVSYATDNDMLARVSINTGDFAPGWRAMLSYQNRQNDGWVDNTDAPGDWDPGAAQSQSLRVAVQGDIGDLTIDYTGAVVRRRDLPPHTQIVFALPDYAGVGATSVGLGGDTLRISSSPIESTRLARAPRSIGDTEDHTLTLTYEVSPELTVKSISGWRSFENDETYVFGSTAGLTLPVLDPLTFLPIGNRSGLLPSTAHQMRHFDQFSQEFQVNGRVDRLQYTAGLYYYDFEYGEALPQQVIVSIGGGASALVLPGNSAYFGVTRSTAAFGQASYTPPILDDNLEVTVGVRYTEDDKEVTITAFPPSGPVQNRIAQTYDNTSYNVTLAYNLTDDLSMYARLGTGYRAGGINARAFRGVPYVPEEATVYEAGVKSEWWDRRVRFNASVYQTDYEDFQTGGPQGVDPDAGFVTDTINAGRARYRGFEAELTVAPVAGLTLVADMAYVDPEFESFEFGGLDVSDVARFIYMSEEQYHLGARYAFAPWSFGALSAQVDYSYMSGPYFTVFAPTTVPPGTPDPTKGEDREELSARLTLGDIQAAGGTAEFSIYGQNLTDDRYKTTAVDFGALGFVAGAFNRPRVIGLEARLAF